MDDDVGLCLNGFAQNSGFVPPKLCANKLAATFAAPTVTLFSATAWRVPKPASATAASPCRDSRIR